MHLNQMRLKFKFQHLQHLILNHAGPELVRPLKRLNPPKRSRLITNSHTPAPRTRGAALCQAAMEFEHN